MNTRQDPSRLEGHSVVMLTWKYPGEQEVRRKVYLTSFDYTYLRKILANADTAEDGERAAMRGTYATSNTLSTDLTVISDLSRLLMVQLVGHVSSPSK
jgi:hypothetical protein